GSAGCGGAQPAGGADRNAGRVIVRVGQGDVGGVEAAVIGVGTGCGGGDNRVDDVAIVDAVVDAGDGDGLNDIPIGRREYQRAGGEIALADVAAGKIEDDIGRRLRS